VAVIAVLVAVRQVVAESAALRREMAAFARLREPVGELRGEALALRARVPELRLRARPGLPPAP
jgi:hypothetical protein